MIKNITALTLSASMPADHQRFNDALSRRAFIPCESQQAKSSGFIAHAETGLFARKLQDHTIMTFAIEKKAVPGKLVKSMLAERVAEFIDRTGGKPSKVEVSDMKESILMELLPKAFPNRTECLVWIDNKSSMLFVDSSSASVVDEVISSLVEAFPDMPPLSYIATNVSPSVAMTKWVLSDASGEDGEPACPGFTIDDRCEMVKPIDGKPTIRYVNHILSGEEIVSYIKDGRMVVSLGMTFNDRVMFNLSDKWILKGIKMTELVSGQLAEDEADWSGEFLVTASLVADLFENLIERMGGLMKLEFEPGSSDESAEDEREAA